MPSVDDQWVGHPKTSQVALFSSPMGRTRDAELVGINLSPILDQANLRRTWFVKGRQDITNAKGDGATEIERSHRNRDDHFGPIGENVKSTTVMPRSLPSFSSSSKSQEVDDILASLGLLPILAQLNMRKHHQEKQRNIRLLDVVGQRGARRACALSCCACMFLVERNTSRSRWWSAAHPKLRSRSRKRNDQDGKTHSELDVVDVQASQPATLLVELHATLARRGIPPFLEQVDLRKHLVREEAARHHEREDGQRQLNLRTRPDTTERPTRRSMVYTSMPDSLPNFLSSSMGQEADDILAHLGLPTNLKQIKLCKLRVEEDGQINLKFDVVDLQNLSASPTQPYRSRPRSARCCQRLRCSSLL